MLDTHELSRRPGTMREFARVVPAPANLGTVVIGIPEGADLVVGLRLESVMEGVLVSGVVRGTAVGECVRCLDPVTEEVTVRVQELFGYPERLRAAEAAGDDELEDEEAVLDGELADIEPAVRDSVVTALPFQPLCRPDCPGLCSVCGARLADDPDHTHDVVDPRWSALQAMLEQSSVTDETKES
ncbi:YceD family protein [Xylanimonas sp. McL0601]|uniref:YceD family protein n=1 Tax=Xylanimonas sp. McL0601 TaxID=3414739 RepID=UPI003CF110F3